MFFQNLNECRQCRPNQSCPHILPSAFWYGRAHTNLFKTEWAFGRQATFLCADMEIMDGESCTDLKFHVGIPWLFSIFLTIRDVFSKVKEPWKKGPRRFGIAYHNMNIWLYTGGKSHESNSKDPWWARSHTFTMPWEWYFVRHEILQPYEGRYITVWQEDCVNYWQALWNRLRRKKFSYRTTRSMFQHKETAISACQHSYPYRYVLKNGTEQNVTATVNAERRTWCRRWFPWVKSRRLSIDVSFSAEVGERTGSWKGGTVGCGYDLREDETLEQALRRMERERKF